MGQITVARFIKMMTSILMCMESIAMKIDTYLVVLDDR